jgi:hypothetical protein
MSQSTYKAQKVTVRNKPGAEGRLTVGANTEVLLDGVRVRGVNFIKIEIGAKKLAKVTIELYAEVEVDGITVALPNQATQKKPSMKTSKGKLIALHELSSYGPTDIVLKKE